VSAVPVLCSSPARAGRTGRHRGAGWPSRLRSGGGVAHFRPVAASTQDRAASQRPSPGTDAAPRRAWSRIRTLFCLMPRDREPRLWSAPDAPSMNLPTGPAVGHHPYGVRSAVQRRPDLISGVMSRGGGRQPSKRTPARTREGQVPGRRLPRVTIRTLRLRPFRATVPPSGSCPGLVQCGWADGAVRQVINGTFGLAPRKRKDIGLIAALGPGAAISSPGAVPVRQPRASRSSAPKPSGSVTTESGTQRRCITLTG
jgi:hypothetical protein